MEIAGIGMDIVPPKVGIKNLTKQEQTGQLIEMAGSTGMVKLSP